jgi:mRNA interferase MazF
MVKQSDYIPDRGDLIWISLNPRRGQEQSGRRPAVVLSPSVYNRKTGLAVLCPVTSKIKGYPFEVVIPEDIEVNGAVLADQVKCLDWKTRRASFICSLPGKETSEVLRKLNTLIGAEKS